MHLPLSTISKEECIIFFRQAGYASI